jgi:hypothetical protein
MVALLSAAGVGAEMRLIPQAGHIEALFDRETLRQALAFADQHLKRGPATNSSSRSSDAN